MDTQRPVIGARGVTKYFPGVIALDSVDLSVAGGTVHCVMGENGAGKSTLVKILTGVYTADEGIVTVLGRDGRHDRSVFDAVAYVPQEIDLFPDLSVAENLFMPFHKSGTGGAFVSRRALYDRAGEYIRRFRIQADPDEPVRNVSVSSQQLLQIARASARRGFHALLMDEPTTSLTDSEAEVLFEIVRELRDEGKAIVFISHKLDELFAVGDVVSVLRNGALVGQSPVREVDTTWIVEKMSGEEVDVEETFRPTGSPGEVVLDVRGAGGPGFDDVSFIAREGEVVGFAGLVGAGRSELLQAVFGYRPHTAGSIRYRGSERRRSPADSIAAGIVYLPEERKTQGIFPSLSVKHNIGIAMFDHTASFSVISGNRERRHTRRIVDEFGVKTPDLNREIMFLSGGNQQKAIIGRAAYGKPKLIIFDEPTKGIDVRAKAEIHRLIQRLADVERAAVILISSELDELMRCAGRIVTLYHGRKTGEFPAATTERSRIVAAIIGLPGTIGKDEA